VPTYVLPHFDDSTANFALALLIGPIAGLVSVAFVRVIAQADRFRPKRWRRLLAPLVALGLLGLVSIPFPQLLGNGKDVAQLAFADQIPFALLLALLVLKPAAIVLCLGSGVPGGLFTPSLALGALLGGFLGHACSWVWPEMQPALAAMVGAGAVLAATTQGPIPAVVLIMELTGKDRSFIAPLLLAVVMATLVSRMIEPRSIYDARLNDEQIAKRQKLREPERRKRSVRPVQSEDHSSTQLSGGTPLPHRFVPERYLFSKMIAAFDRHAFWSPERRDEHRVNPEPCSSTTFLAAFSPTSMMICLAMSSAN
jgi:H+/Cl- antiporter ClcA